MDTTRGEHLLPELFEPLWGWGWPLSRQSRQMIIQVTSRLVIVHATSGHHLPQRGGVHEYAERAYSQDPKNNHSDA
jgi:hypothetical protein